MQDFSNAYKRKPSAFTQDIETALVEQYGSIKKVPPQTDKQKQQLLKRHIKNDIQKYLTLMLLANFTKVPIMCLHTTNKFKFDDQQIYNLLFDNPAQDQNIIDDPATNEQMANIIQDLNKINSKKGKKTLEEQIISYLFIQQKEGSYTSGIITYTLPAKIQEYKDNNDIPVEQKHSTLIGFLDKVPDLLDLQSALLSASYNTTHLYQLAKAVRDFRTAYIEKLKSQQIPPQNNKNANAPKQKTTKIKRLTQKTINYRSDPPSQRNLVENDYKNMLRTYLEGGEGEATRYLAALILTNTETLPYIYNLIAIDEPFMFQILYKINQHKDITDKIANKQQIYDLLKVIKTIHKTNENILTYEGKILRLLFTQYPEGKERIFRYKQHLKALLKDYKQEIKRRVDAQHKPLMDLLDQVTEQLKLEAERLTKESPEKSALNQLIEIMREFLQEYKNKLIKRQPSTQQGVF